MKSKLIDKKSFKAAARKVKYLMLEPTNYCNLDCMGCNRRDVIKTRPLKHMPIEDYNKILEKLEGQPIEEAKFQGLGETFFHPRIHDFFILFKEKFPDTKTITFTNGQYKLKKKNGENTPIGESFEKALPAIDVLLLSCDGWAENYTKHKFPGRWSVFLNFLNELGTYEQIKTGRTKVGLQMIVWEENYKDIEKVFSLREKHSWISEVRLNVFQWWGEDQSASRLSTLDTKGRKINASYDFSEGFYGEMERWKDNIAGKSEWTFSDCWWPNNGLFVESSGDVKVCLLNTDSSPSGNIIRESLDEVLSNEKRNRVSHECETDCPGKHCATCSYKELVPVLKRIGIKN